MAALVNACEIGLALPDERVGRFCLVLVPTSDRQEEIVCHWEGGGVVERDGLRRSQSQSGRLPLEHPQRPPRQLLRLGVLPLEIMHTGQVGDGGGQPGVPVRITPFGELTLTYLEGA